MKIVIEDVTSGDLAAFLREKLAVPTSAPTMALPDMQSLLRKLSPIFYQAVNGQKINAIKSLRELTGCGLKEAKDVVEGNFY